MPSSVIDGTHAIPEEDELEDEEDEELDDDELDDEDEPEEELDDEDDVDVDGSVSPHPLTRPNAAPITASKADGPTI